MTPLNEVILGGVAMASLVATLFFLRFWRQTHDRLFAFFALAFGFDAVMRVALALNSVPDEHEPFFYLGRLVTFALIALAVIDKNRSGTGTPR